MGDYPPDWHRIARAVKEAAGWRCENPSCRHPHDWEAGYVLTVHHKDGNPANCHPDNMVALCQRCHLRAQARLRIYGPEDDRQLRLW
jgi:5-methylcytosine-specific restriction endonuclease McrA